MFASLFGFTGRVGRLTFLVGQIIVLAALIVGTVSIVKLNATTGPRVMTSGATTAVIGVTVLAPVLLFAAFWATIALTIKRAHDLNYTGMVALAALITPLYVILVIVLCLVPGTAGPNKYGGRPGKRLFSRGRPSAVARALSAA